MRTIKIALFDGSTADRECCDTNTPGLVVTQGPDTTQFTTCWWTITHEPSGRIVSYRITGKKDAMIELAGEMAGQDWARQWDEIYQDPRPYQDAIRQAL
jgi:hypothetical protein